MTGSGCAALALSLLHIARSVHEGGSFSVVVLPDTQYYSQVPENAPLFTKQTEWIVDQVKRKGNPRNIVFVSHMGDLVQYGGVKEQWKRANASMSVLGPFGGPFVLPFSALPGNHDNVVVFARPIAATKSSGSEQYVELFGPRRYKGAPWYGGADPSGKNSFQYFSGGGLNFLHVALEWAPNVNVPQRSPSPLEWASQVILAHPGMPVILSTHEYLNDRTARRTKDVGEEVFKNLVYTHDQIFLVLCGHMHDKESSDVKQERDDGEFFQVSKNHLNRPVIEVIQDYQDYPHGGDGWLRILTFDQSKNELRFETYSPVLNKYQEETVVDVGPHASKFTIPLDFAERISKGMPLKPFGYGKAHKASFLSMGAR